MPGIAVAAPEEVPSPPDVLVLENASADGRTANNALTSERRRMIPPDAASFFTVYTRWLVGSLRHCLSQFTKTAKCPTRSVERGSFGECHFRYRIERATRMHPNGLARARVCVSYGGYGFSSEGTDSGSSSKLCRRFMPSSTSRRSCDVSWTILPIPSTLSAGTKSGLANERLRRSEP